jgi:hypothetical protein
LESYYQVFTLFKTPRLLTGLTPTLSHSRKNTGIFDKGEGVFGLFTRPTKLSSEKQGSVPY